MSTREINDRIRGQILQYLYDRNASATSARGKRGAAVKIGDLRRDLKRQHGLTREQVVSNLRYLISQEWVDEEAQQRVVPTNTGRQIPSATIYYAISASGIDKIEGESEFTPRDRFAGIQINASGRSIVTTGDGNQVDVTYQEEGESLANLSNALKVATEIDAKTKMDAVADIDAIQSQLSRSEPNKTIVRAAWESLQSLAKVAPLTKVVAQVGERISQLLA